MKGSSYRKIEKTIPMNEKKVQVQEIPENSESKLNCNVTFNVKDLKQFGFYNDQLLDHNVVKSTKNQYSTISHFDNV